MPNPTLSRTAGTRGRGAAERAIPNHPPFRGLAMGRRKEGAAAAAKTVAPKGTSSTECPREHISNFMKLELHRC
jgi:hypothetical protein